VFKITPDGAETTVASGLDSVSSMAVDAAGDLFICSQDPSNGTSEIVKVTPDGTQSMLVTGLGGLFMTVDGSGNFFVLEGSQVTELKANGTLTTIGSGLNLNQPDGVAVNAAGDVFIADYGNKRVVEVKPDGTQTTISELLGDPIMPTGIAVDGPWERVRSQAAAPASPPRPLRSPPTRSPSPTTATSISQPAPRRP
jgi:DNA-binding beta-propeller fold protein YncE